MYGNQEMFHIFVIEQLPVSTSVSPSNRPVIVDRNVGVDDEICVWAAGNVKTTSFLLPSIL